MSNYPYIELLNLIRTGAFTGYTAGLTPGWVQANVCILPREYAQEFSIFCQQNPASCPLLAVSEPGSSLLPSLGKNLNLKTDLPRYHVFKDGEFSHEVTDISAIWEDDFVAFALGCSFSFEEALLEAGLPLKFLEDGGVAGVYETTIKAKPYGRFRGNQMVTMRPFSPSDAIRAIQVTSRFPGVHGAPIHIGDPAQIGVDLSQTFKNTGSGKVGLNEIPLFWGCGLTPQLAIANARPPISITHAPSSMLLTQIRNSSLAIM